MNPSVGKRRTSRNTGSVLRFLVRGDGKWGSLSDALVGFVMPEDSSRVRGMLCPQFGGAGFTRMRTQGTSGHLV